MTKKNKAHNKPGQKEPFPEIGIAQCKGCGRCVAACPKDLLRMSEDFNASGYRYAVYAGLGCTGCGLCFYTCPEPHAIKIHKNGKADNS